MKVWGVARGGPSAAGQGPVAAELSQLCRVLSVETAAVWMPDDDGARLVLAAAVGHHPPPGPPAELPLAGLGPEAAGPGAEAPAVARVPLTVDGRLVGLLEVPAGTDLGRLGDEAALAIERVRLVEAERRYRLGADHARRHLALVAEAGSALEPPRDDPDLVLRAIVDIVVPAFADWCAVDVPAAGSVRRLVWATGEEIERAHVERLHVDWPGWSVPVLRTIATGETELMARIARSSAFAPEDTDHLALARALGLDSYLIVPVRMRGLTVAVVGFGTAPPRRGFRPSDGGAAEEVARRIAAAVERALLYREIQGQADRAGRRAAQLRRLMEAALAVHARHTVDEVLRVVAEQARRVMGAATGIAGLAAEPEQEGAPLERLYAVSRDESAPAPGLGDDAALWEKFAAVAGSAGSAGSAEGSLSAALSDVAGRAIGAIVVAGSAGEEAGGEASFSDDDESLLVSLAQMASVALESARLHEVEEQLARTRRMEAIGRLAGGVAHDLNNLLTVVLGHSHLLLRAMGSDDAGRESVEAIQMAGERAANLSAQLLTISRGYLVQPELVDLSAAIEAMEEVLGGLLPDEVDLELRPGRAVGPILIGPGQLEQVLLNLVVNSRDAMADGGRVTIATGRRGDSVVVVVTDTGPGMAPEVLEHCFEPFVSTKKRTGAGLGLATVYAIVTQAGGDVSVASTAGAGTTFTLRFPHRAGEVAAEAVADGDEHTAGHEAILLVEDDPAVRGLARRVLEAEGYAVIETESAQEALAVAGAGTPFDLVLTDVAMPDVSGVELAGRLGELRRDLPVLFISGFVEESPGGPVGLPAGADFLAKPFAPATLAAKVRGVLDRD